LLRSEKNSKNISKKVSEKTLLIFLAIFFNSCAVFIGGKSTPPVVENASNRKYLPTLLKILKNAQKEVLFSQLYFHIDDTTGKIISVLDELTSRGVDVRAILEDSVQWNDRSSNILNAIGVYAKLDSSTTFNHAKFFVVDGKVVLVGSTNLSYMSIDRNNEVDVLIKDEKIAGWFREYFFSLWNQMPAPSGVRSGFVEVIPPGKLKDAFVRLFDSAKDKIKIIIYGIRIYPDEKENPVTITLDHLKKAKERGVDVEIVFEISDYNESLNKQTQEVKKYLEEMSFKDLYFDDPKTITHAKLLIVDDAVVLGSSNWGYGGFSLYREANVLIEDKKLASEFCDYFERIKQ